MRPKSKWLTSRPEAETLCECGVKIIYFADQRKPTLCKQCKFKRRLEQAEKTIKSYKEKRK